METGRIKSGSKLKKKKKGLQSNRCHMKTKSLAKDHYRLNLADLPFVAGKVIEFLTHPEFFFYLYKKDTNK